LVSGDFAKSGSLFQDFPSGIECDFCASKGSISARIASCEPGMWGNAVQLPIDSPYPQESACHSLVWSLIACLWD
ncbi:hypothetical protein ABFV55_21290, partial [Pseudomonas syringae]|uniref:hypothetical protein n=1 Tax=Pseudomonas syringae TaxID=317 RepID=UPI0034D96152